MKVFCVTVINVTHDYSSHNSGCLAGMEYRLCDWHVSCDTQRVVNSCRNSVCVSGCFCTNERVLEDGFCIQSYFCPSKK